MPRSNRPESLLMVLVLLAPAIPGQAAEYDIRAYGARADDEEDDTEAIASALSACDEVGGGTVVVPAGTFHRLRNRSSREFVLLTIWPQPATRGANGIHDARLDTWGTGLRFREGCGIRPVADGGRVVTPEHDPLVTAS